VHTPLATRRNGGTKTGGRGKRRKRGVIVFVRLLNREKRQPSVPHGKSGTKGKEKKRGLDRVARVEKRVVESDITCLTGKKKGSLSRRVGRHSGPEKVKHFFQA